jgi:hypothetical protein
MLRNVLCSAVHLPASNWDEHMDVAWKVLQDRFSPMELDPELRELCPPSVALLTTLVVYWRSATKGPTAAKAIFNEFVTTKLLEEVSCGFQVCQASICSAWISKPD